MSEKTKEALEVARKWFPGLKWKESEKHEELASVQVDWHRVNPVLFCTPENEWVFSLDGGFDAIRPTADEAARAGAEALRAHADAIYTALGVAANGAAVGQT